MCGIKGEPAIGLIKKRSANIEILRIISMIMVTVHHTVIINENYLKSINYYLYFILIAMCFGAVNLFVLISGYFMVNSSIKVHKFLMLWGEVLFYTVGLYCISVLFKIQTFSIKELIFSFMPILHKSYWFMSVYMVFYLIIPLLNHAIHKMSKQEMQLSLFALFIIFCLIPTFLRPYLAEVFTIYGGYSLDWFVVLYFFGAYLQLYVDMKPEKRFGHYFSMYALFTAITFSSKIISDLMQKYLKINGRHYIDLYNYNSVTVLFATVYLFLAFRALTVREDSKIEKFVLRISPCALSVYLIQLNPHLRSFIYYKALNTMQYYEKIYFIPYVLFCVLLVFAISCMIDMVRQFIFKKLDTELFRKFCTNLQNGVLKLSTQFANKLLNN